MALMRRLIRELSYVVEEIEVFHHEFDDLWVVAGVRTVSAILRCFQLDDSSLSFLVSVRDKFVSERSCCRTLNAPLFGAVLKYLE